MKLTRNLGHRGFFEAEASVGEKNGEASFGEKNVAEWVLSCEIIQR